MSVLTHFDNCGELRHAILKDSARKFEAGVEWQMHVTDAGRRTVFKLHCMMDEAR